MIKEKIINLVNITFHILLLLTISLGIFIWADTNSVWHFPQDIKPGIFGTDEDANILNNYTFINHVFLTKTIYFGNLTSCITLYVKMNNEITCGKNLSPLVFECNKLGLVWNNNTNECEYLTGIDTIPDTINFNNITNAELETEYLSNEITVTGIEGELYAEFSGDSTTTFLINGENKGTSTTILPRDKLKIKMRSANDFEKTTRASIKVGTYNTTWIITTKSKPCDPLTIDNGIVTSSPDCSIICNSKYVLSPDKKSCIQYTQIMRANTASDKGYYVGNIPTGYNYGDCWTGYNVETPAHECTQYCYKGWSWAYICKKLFFDENGNYLNLWENVDTNLCGAESHSGSTCNP